MKEISIQVIPHAEERYETPGDYWYDENGVLQVRVSDMDNWDMEFLVFLHELIEEHLTKRDGITEQEIMDFDLMFEDERARGLHTDDEEPGWDKRSPYRKYHAFSEKIERMVCKKMGIDWDEYSKRFQKLPKWGKQ